MAKPLAVYLHIPFCRQKCGYCDFLSFAGREDLFRPYLEALVQEIRLLAGERPPVATVYIGGGTPTLLSGEDLASLLQEVKAATWLDPAAEITVEANPGTVTLEQLRVLRAAGVNRLSIGAQAGQDKFLRLLGRSHTAAQTGATVAAARAAGFTNINLDLIYGLPGQAVAEWRESLEWAVALEPDHLSCYCLQLAPEVPLAKAIAAGHYRPVVEEEIVAMYYETLRILAQAGYEQYELANFARKGYECRHNLFYWEYRDYLGLGLGSHSFLSGERRVNEEDFPNYFAKVAAGEEPVAVREKIDAGRGMVEMVMLGLRLTKGLDAKEFFHRWRRDLRGFFSPRLEILLEKDFLRWEGDNCRLTPKGMLASNRVLVELLDVHL
ncbi:MAG: radical SAM family heme chaperone HemW [Firmicutes bacterium]|jgi:oxygen-independent coproporphyrinogen-3 oxidase|nr:radical SAM family heme chaperone HemW [Bacillota bacterium]